MLPTETDEYATRYSSPEHPILAALNRETNLRRGDAVMLSGSLQGQFLQQISHMIRPRRILEIGTFTGYSAICLAQGLQEGGMLHTIEIDEELQDIATKYIALAGLTDKVTQHIGDATTLLRTLEGPFDLVFIDADKLNYELYFDLVFPMVPIGGFLVADNVLYGGEVLLPETQQSKNAKAIQRFNNKILAEKRIQHLMVPLRDGLTVARKVAD